MIHTWKIKWERSPGMGCPGYNGEFTINTLEGGEEGRTQARTRAFRKIKEEMLLTPNKLTVIEMQNG